MLVVSLLVAGCQAQLLLDPFDGGAEPDLDASQLDSAAAEQPLKLDFLYVIENRIGTCWFQDQLVADIEPLLRGLADVRADVRMGVITSDMDEASTAGRLRSTPARFHSETAHPMTTYLSYVCSSDADCGGGCRCGLPWLHPCERDEDCADPTPLCREAAAGSSFRFCSRLCEGPQDNSCLDPKSPNSVFVCASDEQRGEHRCQLRTCSDDSDCLPVGLGGQFATRCMAHGPEPHIGFCRRWEHFEYEIPEVGCPFDEPPTEHDTCLSQPHCPTHTCGCPHDLEPILSFDWTGGANEQEFAAAASHFRCLATAGGDGSLMSQGLAAIERFVLLDGLAGPVRFVRADAHLVVVILSSLDDCSNEGLELRPDPRCVWNKERLRPVGEFAELLRSLKAPNEVAVLALVGDRQLSCLPSLQQGDGTFVSSELCAELQPCPGGTVCAERVYRGNGDGPLPVGDYPLSSCSAAPNVEANAGTRYDDFARQFRPLSLTRSVCSASYRPALQQLVELLAPLSAGRDASLR